VLRADNFYHLHVPIVIKSGSLNLLEPSGPVKVCNGIALPLPLTHYVVPTLLAGERCAQGVGGETLGKEAIGEIQT
jgi:hypothetical protein